MDWYEDVMDFHKKFDSDIGEKPEIPNARIKKLRIDTIKEETKELKTAFQQKDIVEVADAIVDLMYFTIGTAIACGIDIRPVWDEVHRTNMLKTGGGKRADGKILKPKGWKAPDIAAIIERQQNEIK